MIERDKNPSVNKKSTASGDFPIVGVGASAGGLEAFAELLNGLETDSGMAFVLIQHLDPNHESMLGEILSRATTMQVSLVEDEMAVEPDHVYVIPPNARMSFAGGKLHLSPRGKGEKGLFLIDHFFLSLVHELKDKAIGVILSGTGTDGANGIAAMSEAGGATFAQDQDSAKFDGMPLAALSKGAEIIQPPKGIAQALAKMAHASKEGNRPSDTASAAFQKILALLKSVKSADFSQYKMPTIERRIDRRMARHEVDRREDYLAYLKSHPAEIDCLYEDILIKVTEFFREPDSFEALKRTVIQPLLSREPPISSFRVWVPGCATGEEAYSIAICLMECLESHPGVPKIEIFATDISESALAIARAGYYDQSRLANISPARLKRFFIKDGRGYRVHSSLREPCVFAKQDVSRDPPFSRLDLISCRNLLIYLTPRLQERVLSAFHFALNADGFLTLGKSETIGRSTHLFDVADKSGKIFKKKQTSRNAGIPDFALAHIGTKRASSLPDPEGGDDSGNGKQDIRSDADQAVLKKLLPPGVVVNDRLEVVQYRGDTSAFLFNPPGDVTNSLLKMCRSGLLTEVRTALQEGAAKDEPVTKLAWTRSRGQDSTAVSIQVVPFIASGSGAKHYVVLFAPGSEAVGALDEPTAEERNQVSRLERELSETKEYLNDIIEREQAANEELKSASEEILSANEELQSTNEEMATAKEEVQATNEELITVNEELGGRFQELNRANNDLSNLFGAANIPIVMISKSLAIRRFTQAAEKALNLTDTDAGTPLEDIRGRLAVEGLEKLAARVIETLVTIEQEIQNREGRWYSLRIKPYRTADNKVEGAIIVLLDIDTLKRSLAQITEAREYAEAIIETAPTPLLVLNDELRVVTATDAFYKHFHVSVDNVKDKKIYDLGGGRWNVPQLHELLEVRLPQNEKLDDFFIHENFPEIGRRILRLNARRLVQTRDKAARILIAIDDVTHAQQDAQRTLDAKDAAEAANKAKTEFLANMSHEIRTPLSAILGYSEVLSSPALSKASVLESVSRIRKNVEQLNELIDEILDISKIEAGKLEIDRVRFPIVPELGDVFTLLKDRADAKGLSFKVTFEGAIPESVLTCPMRLRQILLNLIGNALKFTDQGGVEVVIKLEDEETATENRSLCFIIKDTGCGLTHEQQQRLFRPFVQADSSVTRKYGGTGLGLVLARRLAEALGGGVAILDSKLGEGSVFMFSLDPGPLVDVPRIRGLTQEDIERGRSTPVEAFTPNRLLENLTILLAEDAPELQALMTHFLEASGATVEAAVNGEEALNMALTSRFDLVLMDMQMPVLDGYEATRRLRVQGCDTPVVALTANAMRGERERCFAAGCVRYVSKPVKANTLINVVARYARKPAT